jgi:hypothetical protein
MSSKWRLRIWQHPTIGRILARATRRPLTSEGGANSGLTLGLDEHTNVVSTRESQLWRTVPADNTERDGQFWRKLEEEARAVAAEMTDPQPRRRMLLIAECYKFLTDRAEIRKSCKDVIRGSRQHIVADGHQGGEVGRDEHPNP